MMPIATALPAWELSPREPHLYDYLLILRKHQWLILSFMLSVVTIVAIATFRMQPVYVATARIEIGRENSNILPFQGTDAYDMMMDSENYIETQSKILTSETLALQTIRNSGLSARPEYSSPTGLRKRWRPVAWRIRKRPPELAAFLGSLSVRRVPNSRLDGREFRINGPAISGTNRKRAPRNVSCSEISKANTIPRARATTLAARSTRGAEEARAEFGRRAHRLRTAKPDLDAGRQTKHDHPAILGRQPGTDAGAKRANEETIAYMNSPNPGI